MRSKGSEQEPVLGKLNGEGRLENAGLRCRRVLLKGRPTSVGRCLSGVAGCQADRDGIMSVVNTSGPDEAQVVNRNGEGISNEPLRRSRSL